jgi:hypothetical protein
MHALDHSVLSPRLHYATLDIDGVPEYRVEPRKETKIYDALSRLVVSEYIKHLAMPGVGPVTRWAAQSNSSISRMRRVGRETRITTYMRATFVHYFELLLQLQTSQGVE